MKNLNKIPVIDCFRLCKKDRSQLYIGMGLNIACVFAVLLIPVIVGDFLSVITEGSGCEEFDIFMLARVFFVMLCIYVLQGISSIVLGNVGANMMYDLQEVVFYKLVNAEEKSIEEYSAGDISSRITNDIRQMALATTTIIPAIIKNVLIIVFSSIILFVLNWKMTIMLILLCFLIIVPSRIINNKLEKLYLVQQELLGNISTKIVSFMNNSVVVKSYAGEKYEQDQFEDVAARLRNNTHSIVRCQTFWNTLSTFLLMGGLLGVVVFASSQGFIRRDNVEILSMYVLYMIQMLSPISEIVDMIMELQESNAASKRILHVSEISEEDKHTGKNNIIENGQLRFSDVSFNYDSGKNVLNKLSFEIPAGKSSAIVGPSGVGKTTMLALVSKIIGGYEGQITIDGIDLKDLSVTSLREQISFVTQGNLIFGGTVMDNLRYGKNKSLSKDEINSRLKENKLEKIFCDFDNGLNTEVGEAGCRLSEGQKQRVNVARAFVSDAKILLLDEVTSNLDPDNEAIIMEAIKAQNKKRTVIMITHKIRTVKNADLVMVVDKNGTIKEQNTRDYLRENSELYIEKSIRMVS